MRTFPVRLLLLFTLVTIGLSNAEEKVKYWVFFADKGPALQKASLQQLEAELDEFITISCEFYLY